MFVSNRAIRIAKEYTEDLFMPLYEFQDPVSLKYTKWEIIEDEDLPDCLKDLLVYLFNKKINEKYDELNGIEGIKR